MAGPDTVVVNCPVCSTASDWNWNYIQYKRRVMSTIVAVSYRGERVMAADTMVSAGDLTYPNVALRKIVVCDGGLVGIAGDAAAVTAAQEFEFALDAVGATFRDFRRVAKKADWTAIVLLPDAIYTVDPDGSILLHVGYASVGSGAPYALGSVSVQPVEAGASVRAQQAVWAAMQFDTCTGGEIITERL